MPQIGQFGSVQGNNTPAYSSRIRNQPEDFEEKSESVSPKANENFAQSVLPNIVQRLFGDEKIDFERLLLVVLIILLASDGADLTLLLALGYLLI